MRKPDHIKICLNGMVGSEEATIERMLKSVVGYVDYYVIQCNGKDRTQEIIDAFFAEHNIPGFTYHIDWNFPGWNRDHTLQTCLKADHGCDWILRMDADEQLSVADDFDWSPFENLFTDSFNITADAGDSLYFRTWLWNAHRPWYFSHDKRHETIHLPEVDEEFERVTLDKGFRHIITNDGETWLAPMKFLTDALELERDKVPSNLVLEDDYHLWYIGKSYSDSYGNPSEFPFGVDHANEYARRAIFYFNMYLNKTHDYANTQRPKEIDDMAYYAMYLIGNAYDFMGDTDAALDAFNRANDFNPRRNEAIYRMAEIFEKQGNAEEMLRMTGQLVDPSRTNPFPEFSFLLHNSSYYDTNILPFWMHIKALKLNNMDFTLTAKRMREFHTEIPAFVQQTISDVKKPTEAKAKSEFNPNLLSGVFGITR